VKYSYLKLVFILFIATTLIVKSGFQQIKQQSGRLTNND